MDKSNITTAPPPEIMGVNTPQSGLFDSHQLKKLPYTPGIQPGDIKLDNIQAVQDIQSHHPDFANLNEYEQSNLRISLAQAGLPETGAILNTLA